MYNYLGYFWNGKFYWFITYTVEIIIVNDIVLCVNYDVYLYVMRNVGLYISFVLYILQIKPWYENCMYVPSAAE